MFSKSCFPLLNYPDAEIYTRESEERNFMLVPTINKDGKPLMPCTPSKARLLIKSGKATPFYTKGVFAIRLNYGSSGHTQDVIIGFDPGSKRTGITVATTKKTVIHLQCDAPGWVKKNVETRRQLRRSRRQRNTPYRKCRFNRVIGSIPPSTKARWDTHLRILNKLRKILPISIVSVEDIQAKAKMGKGRWNRSFSPLEVGKKYFYDTLVKIGMSLRLFSGWETHQHRQVFGYRKIQDKLSTSFDAHCVDSHSLCEMANGGLIELTSKKIYHLTLLEFSRRQLHVQNFIKGGIRKLYGSTRSLILNRGTLVKHSKFNLCYVGGQSKDRISLHGLNKKRLTQSAKVTSCKVLTNQSFLTILL